MIKSRYPELNMDTLKEKEAANQTGVDYALGILQEHIDHPKAKPALIYCIDNCELNAEQIAAIFDVAANPLFPESSNVQGAVLRAFGRESRGQLMIKSAVDYVIYYELNSDSVARRYLQHELPYLRLNSTKLSELLYFSATHEAPTNDRSDRVNEFELPTAEGAELAAACMGHDNCVIDEKLYRSVRDLVARYVNETDSDRMQISLRRFVECLTVKHEDYQRDPGTFFTYDRLYSLLTLAETKSQALSVAKELAKHGADLQGGDYVNTIRAGLDSKQSWANDGDKFVSSLSLLFSESERSLSPGERLELLNKVSAKYAKAAVSKTPGLHTQLLTFPYDEPSGLEVLSAHLQYLSELPFTPQASMMMFSTLQCLRTNDNQTQLANLASAYLLRHQDTLHALDVNENEPAYFVGRVTSGNPFSIAPETSSNYSARAEAILAFSLEYADETKLFDQLLLSAPTATLNSVAICKNDSRAKTRLFEFIKKEPECFIKQLLPQLCPATMQKKPAEGGAPFFDYNAGAIAKILHEDTDGQNLDDFLKQYQEWSRNHFRAMPAKDHELLGVDKHVRAIIKAVPELSDAHKEVLVDSSLLSANVNKTVLKRCASAVAPIVTNQQLDGLLERAKSSAQLEGYNPVNELIEALHKQGRLSEVISDTPQYYAFNSFKQLSPTSELYLENALSNFTDELVAASANDIAAARRQRGASLSIALTESSGISVNENRLIS